MTLIELRFSHVGIKKDIKPFLCYASKGSTTSFEETNYHEDLQKLLEILAKEGYELDFYNTKS